MIPKIKKQKETLNIDWDFIKILEGFEVKGYVPSEKHERNNRVVSGVTIASGFDLGQHSAEYFKEIKLSPKIIQKLLPYMGLKGAKARRKLKELPLILTVEQANDINKAVKHNKAMQVAKLYNRDSEIDFFSLPRAIQTVIMSVGFQYGDLSKRTPNFWRVVTSGDWERAVGHLRGFGDDYDTRRNQEANVLALHLKEKGIA